MTNSEIIAYIHDNEEFYNSVEGITGSDPLTDDLYAELLCIIAEQDNDKLNGMIERDELKFFFVRICLNQWRSTSSPFYKYYRDNDKNDNLDDVPETDLIADNPLDLDNTDENSIFYEEQYGDKVRRLTDKFLEDMYWYNRELFLMYVKLGSYRAVSEETGIPIRSVGSTLKQTRESLQRKINKYLEKTEKPIDQQLNI